MREFLVGTTEVMDPSFISRDRGTIMGAALPGHPVRAQPHEGNCERTSSSLHGCFGATNRIPIHGRGTTLPSPNKVQNALDRNVRRNERFCKPPQYLQELDGATRIPEPR